jgi:AcrR family transcriptional regulator
MGYKDIQEKILTMFTRYGIRSITMDDIARELGISKKTLYHEFEDKNDLIKRVIDYDILLNRQFMEEVNRANLNAIEELFYVNERIHEDRVNYSPTFYYDLKKYHPDTYQRWLDDKRQNMFDLIVSNLQKGKQEGVFREDIHEQSIGKLYVARMEMMNNHEISDVLQTITSDFMQEIFNYHLHGICNATGLNTLAEFKDKSDKLQVKEI